ncbi:MAG: ribosome biogenesis GTPase Der [Clostridia bacterium]|nr:ribosome biogenesis GTPase Der [Clostridia bacterium]
MGADTPCVVVAGRPNVGKSTLFNRLVGRRQAIVEDTPGVTRDRIEGTVTWRNRTFRLVDTGGLGDRPRAEGEDQAPEMAAAVRKQAEMALAAADLVLLIVDARTGVQPADLEAADLVRRVRRPVVLVANKVDGPAQETLVHEFHRLGLGEPLPVSAEGGRGIGDLLDHILARLPLTEVSAGAAAPADAEPTRVAIVGRPNVGKSSLLNRLVGEERVVVSPLPGTTRDAVDVEVVLDGHRFCFVDTAGMRRRARVDGAVEFYSVRRALRAMERADLAVLVLDGPSGVTAQDQRIGGLVLDAGKACLIVVNKWDLLQEEAGDVKAYDEDVRAALHFLRFAPTLHVSALTGEGVDRLPVVLRQVAERYGAEYDTALLERIVRDAVVLRPPPAPRLRRGRPTGRRGLRVLGVRQVGRKPPTFAIVVDDTGSVPPSYARYLENRLREAVDFTGTPIRLRFEARRAGVQRARS